MPHPDVDGRHVVVGAVARQPAVLGTHEIGPRRGDEVDEDRHADVIGENAEADQEAGLVVETTPPLGVHHSGPRNDGRKHDRTENRHALFYRAPASAG